ncbi:MAG: Ig-like domain-containing protein, partial [Nitrospiraceae bacterium]
TFTYQAHDGQVLSNNVATVALTIVAVNDAPVLGAIGNRTVGEGATLTFTLNATDADLPGNLLTFSASGLPTGATFDAGTRTFSWTPTEAQGPGVFNGITFSVSDGLVTTSETISITVGEVNQAPVLNAIGNQTVNELSLLTFVLGGSDADLPANTLTFSASNLPTGASFDAGTRTFSWTPTEAQGPGLFTGITFSVSDGLVTTSETISITVGEVNQAPVLGAIGNRSAQVGQLLTFTVTATDADQPANGLFLTSSALPTGATFDAGTGVFSWTPTAGQVGDTSLTFTVTDNGSPVLNDSETITLTVTAQPNQNPVANPDGPYAATEDQLLTVLAAQGVLANDSDPNSDPLSATLLAQATNGLVTLASTGGFTYAPNANFTGADSFSYTLSDGRGGTATATVALTIVAVNDAPVAVNDSYSTNEDALLIVNAATGVLSNDSDIDSVTLTTGSGVALIGTQLSIQTIFQSTPIAQPSVIGFLTTATVTEPGVEFPSLRALEVNNPPFGLQVVDVAINVGENFIEIDFDNSLPFTSFASGYRNGYLFTFDHAVAPTITGAVIDTAVTTLGLSQSDLLFENNSLFVNVESLPFNTSTFARINLTVARLNPAVVTGPANGTLLLNANGSFSYTPNANFNGTDSFTYKANDGALDSNIATVNLTINPVNDAPMLGVIGNQSLNELTGLSFTATATDVDAGQTRSFSLDTAALALGATIDAATGVFSWTPTEAQGAGTYALTITVTDNGTPALSASETIQVQVNEVNQAPVLNAIGNQTVNELSLLTFVLGGSDADLPANTLTFSASGLPAGATFEAATRTFSWTPTEAQGPGLFAGITFSVSDGLVTTSETISITVGEVNQAPVLGAIGNRSAQVGQLLTFTVTATDADQPANDLLLTSSALPTGATFDAGTGVFSWTPTAGQVGDQSLTFTVTDDGSPVLNDSETITLTVTAQPNQNPVANPDGPYAATEDQLFTVLAAQGVLANDSDPNSDPLSATLLAQATNGLVTLASTGGFTYAPNANFNGSDSFSYTLSDGRGGTATATVALTIVAVNDAPVLNVIGNMAVDEQTALSFTATATDVDAGQTRSFSLDAAALALGATIDAATGAFSWTPTEAQGAGLYNVTITVTDNGTPALSDSETIQITVNEVNQAPVLNAIGNQTVNEGQLLTFIIGGSDADLPANPLTFSASGLPTGATFDAATRTFSWTPTEAQGPGLFNGITFSVSDGLVTTSETISITVGEVNQAPVLGAIGNRSAQVGQLLTFTVTATDADLPANGLTLSNSVLPTGATFDAGTGVFSWTPTAGQVGDTTVTFTVTDNGSPVLTDSETITLTVTAQPNQNPVAQNDGPYAATEDQLLTVLAAQGVLANDSDPNSDPLSVTLLQQAANGFVTLASNGGFTYAPNGNFNGTDSFSYTLSDGRGGTTTATVALTIAAVNDAPVLGTIGNQSVNELTGLSFTATATDVDAGQTRSFSLDTAALALGATIDATTGVFSWTPTEAQGAGLYNVTITVTDNGTPALSDSET